MDYSIYITSVKLDFGQFWTVTSVLGHIFCIIKIWMLLSKVTYNGERIQSKQNVGFFPQGLNSGNLPVMGIQTQGLHMV